MLPRHVRTIWERGRYVEYLLAFSFFKRVQDHYGKPLISSGCFSIYRTAELRAAGGWSTRTMAEDMDLTWTLYRAATGCASSPRRSRYPIEPHDFDFMGKQLRRWSHGFVQNVRLHWRSLLELGYLRSMVAVALLGRDGGVVRLPGAAAGAGDPGRPAGPARLPGRCARSCSCPVLWQAVGRGEAGRALGELPELLRPADRQRRLHAQRRSGDELVVGRPLLVYEKGH